MENLDLVSVEGCCQVVSLSAIHSYSSIRSLQLYVTSCRFLMPEIAPTMLKYLIQSSMVCLRLIFFDCILDFLFPFFHLQLRASILKYHASEFVF